MDVITKFLLALSPSEFAILGATGVLAVLCVIGWKREARARRHLSEVRLELYKAQRRAQRVRTSAPRWMSELGLVTGARIRLRAQFALVGEPIVEGDRMRTVGVPTAASRTIPPATLDRLDTADTDRVLGEFLEIEESSLICLDRVDEERGDRLIEISIDLDTRDPALACVTITDPGEVIRTTPKPLATF